MEVLPDHGGRVAVVLHTVGDTGLGRHLVDGGREVTARLVAQEGTWK